MENEILYRRAAVRATMQRAFYRHVMIYIVVNVLLAAVNLLKDPTHLWFQWDARMGNRTAGAWTERLFVSLVRIAP
jgi:2TM domain